MLRSNYTTYQDYIKSPEWKQKSKLFKLQNPECYVCGSSENLHVHHITYDRLGHEHSWDMVSLCAFHHKKVHFSNKGKFMCDYKRIYNMVKSMRDHFKKMKRIKESKKVTNRQTQTP